MFWCVLHFITFSSCAIHRMNEMWDQNSFLFSTFICVGKMMPCNNCKFTGQQSIIGNFICRYKTFLYEWFIVFNSFNNPRDQMSLVILIINDIMYLTWCNESTQWKPNIQKHNYNFPVYYYFSCRICFGTYSLLKSVKKKSVMTRNFCCAISFLKMQNMPFLLKKYPFHILI